MDWLLWIGVLIPALALELYAWRTGRIDTISKLTRRLQLVGRAAWLLVALGILVHNVLGIV